MSDPDDQIPSARLASIGTVGNDVVDRAKLRFYRTARGTVKFQNMLRDRHGRVDGSIDCAVCHWHPRSGSSWRRSKVGGLDVAICDRCAQLAVSVNDYHPDLRSCLVILATNVERAAGGHDHGSGGPWFDADGVRVVTSGIRRRIHDSFAHGFYAQECQCPAHVAARGPQDRAFTPPPPPGSSPDVTGLSLSMIRSFQEKGLTFEGKLMDRKEVVAILEERNKSGTAYPGAKPGGSAERGLKLATQANARLWLEAHHWEREASQPFAGINDRSDHTVIEFDLVDLDLVIRVLDRQPGDVRAYCDWCGVVDDTVGDDGVTWCCLDCAKSSNLIGSRINRLYVWLRAFRSGASISFVDPDGKPCRR